MTRYIVVAGGVISGVGKGVSTASIGKILQNYGFSVTAVKIDPYINSDAGTLRPTEHGEVWVTDDGGEIDQDLGNYERFLNQEIPKRNNITTGQVYGSVIEKERKGAFLGHTVQFIPHIIDEIKSRVVEAGKGKDFVLVEIGGVVGDYENIPFLLAMKSIERDIGRENMLYVLVTYLFVPRHIEEMKTKPTQQAIRLLAESSGIEPDLILCRAPISLDLIRKKKIEVYANIKADYVISEPDIDTIYRIPLDLEAENVGRKILEKFKIQAKSQPDWSSLRTLVNKIANPKRTIRIAIVGKYVDSGDFVLKDSYISIIQALIHAGASNDVGIDIEWIDAKKLEENPQEINKLSKVDGLIIPGGFGNSGVEGKILAIKYARENNLPFLGLCYGLQLAIVEFARNVANLQKANTTEVDEQTPNPVIDILPIQKELMLNKEYGGTMRLGAYAATLSENSVIEKLYKSSGRLEKDSKRIEKLRSAPNSAIKLGLSENKTSTVLERHRHRFEVSPKYTPQLEAKGLLFSGFHLREDNTKLVEFIELPKHKFFVATQAHPEFKSSLEDPAPLFLGLVESCLK
jgi:CTP synthase